MDRELKSVGGPYRFGYVREAAIQLIDPHHNWESGIKIDPLHPP